ncbi:HAD-IIA family hydrolase [Catenisphaera adipataccumulans]|jgi:4-nitrophenyl phosphatase|uniref:HAD superfamily hydrolase (TIGR01450 family) n=2 Tax=Catenisphaera adipataccumulans TaxID=700500 RepID=A0A7W8FWU5_9FIRM|nr:HAD-IIA family hydrolase [Catenisphaera adipataccumulans]MBB5182317.1 HAD superfamily hydrolase (TIGR01450 family) [Catenisphaera adipataccumulans]
MLPKDKALDDIKLFVLDMDGTVYLGSKLINGSLDFIRQVDALPDRDYIFFTNNASRVPSFYVQKLAKMGLKVEESRIVTAGDVTAEFLQENYPGARIYLNGTPLLEENWKAKGLHLVDEDPDVAVQSFDTTLTYEKLDKICRYVRNGVPFIATHMDTNCPTEDGFMPDCGAMCSLITDSTGVKPRFLGKPWKETVEMITAITGCPPANMGFVGDRLYTDVATGVNNGAKGFLVLTGEADMQTVAESDVEPTCIYESLKEMKDYL